MRNDTIRETLELLYRFPRMMHTNVHQMIFKPVLQAMPADLAPHLMAVLKVLDVEGTLTIGEICDLTDIAKAQMTHSIDRLTDLAMIRREPRSDDRRKIAIVITEKGKETVAAFEAALNIRMVDALAFLKDEELQEVVACLRYLVSTFERLKNESHI